MTLWKCESFPNVLFQYENTCKYTGHSRVWWDRIRNQSIIFLGFTDFSVYVYLDILLYSLAYISYVTSLGMEHLLLGQRMSNWLQSSHIERAKLKKICYCLSLSFLVQNCQVVRITILIFALLIYPRYCVYFLGMCLLWFHAMKDICVPLCGSLVSLSVINSFS